MNWTGRERLETSIGGFTVEWGVRFELGSDSPPETGLTLAPEGDAADSPRGTWVGSAEGIEGVLVRAGVPVDEARSLATHLWEQRWRVEEDRRRREEEGREYQRVRSELKEAWGDQAEVHGIRLVRQWTGFVATVEAGYDSEWEYYANELMVRDYIAEICERLPNNRRAAYLAEAVAPWDERFRAATTEESEPFGLAGDRGKEAWWAYRRPRLWRSDSD
jgi:hypothetical protein